MENIKIQNFLYNGFMGQSLEGEANYTATFKEWTNDPGIAVCICSDGIERRIPTFAFIDIKSINLPKQHYKDGIPDMFSHPSNS